MATVITARQEALREVSRYNTVWFVSQALAEFTRLQQRISAFGEVLHPKEAQLYPVLHRLENDGMIEAQWVPQEGKPSRKVYALTEDGRRHLETKRTQWERFSTSVSQLMRPGKDAVVS